LANFPNSWQAQNLQSRIEIGKTRGFPRFLKLGTPPAMLLASPTGRTPTSRFRETIMSYQATTLRNAFVATAFAFLISATLLATTVSVPMA
jgi:hypothetical protein